jgi:hypothetical protein
LLVYQSPPREFIYSSQVIFELKTLKSRTQPVLLIQFEWKQLEPMAEARQIDTTRRIKSRDHLSHPPVLPLRSARALEPILVKERLPSADGHDIEA